jgi:hypothetical protein
MESYPLSRVTFEQVKDKIREIEVSFLGLHVCRFVLKYEKRRTRSTVLREVSAKYTTRRPYLLTYSLTPRCRIFFEKLTVTKLVKQQPVLFMEPEGSLPC